MEAYEPSSGCHHSRAALFLIRRRDPPERTNSGEGIDPQGQREAWIATVPAPASALTLLAIPLLARRR